jgi:hypothetical protein
MDLQEILLGAIKPQQLTRGHKTLGAKWLFDPLFSHQSSLYLDREVAPKTPTFHTAEPFSAIYELKTNI